MADDTVFRTMLLDFYGELLTEKQREYYDLHYNDDLSLAEIAEQSGVSRQAVWDIIRRAEQTLSDVEAKTGLIRRFTERREAAAALESDLSELCRLADGELKPLAERALTKLRAMEE